MNGITFAAMVAAFAIIAWAINRHIQENRCPVHHLPLIHEAGGPDMPSIHGRTYCPQCQQDFLAALAALPMYQHDCDECFFLGRAEACEWWEDGRYLGRIEKDADLYFCGQMGSPTVIARYSSEGPDYTSGLYEHMTHPHLVEARERAIEHGLLPARITEG